MCQSPLLLFIKFQVLVIFSKVYLFSFSHRYTFSTLEGICKTTRNQMTTGQHDKERSLKGEAMPSYTGYLSSPRIFFKKAANLKQWYVSGVFLCLSNLHADKMVRDLAFK